MVRFFNSSRIRDRFRQLVVALSALIGCIAPSEIFAEDSQVLSTPIGSERGSTLTSVRTSAAPVAPTVPAWAADAIYYQIFPERFCNGDTSNDPTRESLESPESVPPSWRISPWTGDWYARAGWEKQRGPDFYADGVFDRRYGGDLQGIIERLDYLTNLGVNTIYLNPVFYARSLHKYDSTSLHHADPYFGPDPRADLKTIAQETSDPATWKWTTADKLFLKLLQQAHARKLRVVIDGVFNHTGRDFFAFADLRNRQAASAYRDWYIVQSFDDPATPQNEFRYKGWWGVPSLPEFAHTADGNDLHPGPKQYIFSITKRWMDPNGDGDPSDGVDGWRLDAAKEVPTGFWCDWHALARRINPQCYTVSENWEDASRFVSDGRFSAAMNYAGFAFPTKGFLIDETLAPTGAAKLLTARRQEFTEATQYALQNLIDSHDTDRLPSMIVNAGRRPYSQTERFDYDAGASPRFVPTYDIHKPKDAERRIQRIVVLFQMTYVGAPMVYYGSEAGMWGADDPCDRMPMVWPELRYDVQRGDPLNRSRKPDTVAFDHDLFNYYRAVIALRRNSESLTHGDIQFITADDKSEFLGYSRQHRDEKILVGVNRGKAAYQWTISLKDRESVAQIFTASGDADQFVVTQTRSRAEVTVPAVDAVVLRVSTTR